MIRPIVPEVWNEGVREAERLIALIDGPDSDGTEFGDAGTVLEFQKFTVEMYATALFGPTSRVFFILNDDGDVREAFLSHFTGGDEVLIPLPENRQDELLAALRIDNAELERHG